MGRERAQPRHRDQRREVQPRLDGRADRRRAALLPREPRHPSRRRRAADRARLLRRGARPAPGAGARRRSCARGSPPSSTPDGSRWARRDDVGHDRPRRARAGHGPPRRRSADVAVAVVRIDDDVYAIGDVCSHANVSLSEGEVWCDEREIECPKHGSTFSLTTGEPARCRPPSRCRCSTLVVADGDRRDRLASTMEETDQ